MLNILLMIILLIIIIIFIIIAVGIRLTLEWKKIDDKIEGCVKILILKKINIHTIEINNNEKEDDEPEDKKDRDFKEIFELAKPCLEYIKIFLVKLFKSIKIGKLENHLIIGFSNFADTGEYIGYIWAVLSILNSIIPNSRLTAEPSFKGEIINFKGYANIDISILKLIKPLIDLLLKKEIRTLIKGVLNG